jgi:hypothetical protein
MDCWPYSQTNQFYDAGHFKPAQQGSWDYPMSLVDLIKYIKSKTYHKCERNELYFEEYNVRGTFCAICLEPISYEVYE